MKCLAHDCELYTTICSIDMTFVDMLTGFVVHWKYFFLFAYSDNRQRVVDGLCIAFMLLFHAHIAQS